MIVLIFVGLPIAVIFLGTYAVVQYLTTKGSYHSSCTALAGKAVELSLSGLRFTNETYAKLFIDINRECIGEIQTDTVNILTPDSSLVEELRYNNIDFLFASWSWFNSTKTERRYRGTENRL